MKIKPAQATLNQLDNGRVMEQLAEAIHEGLAAVRQFGKPAVISLDITINVMKEAHQGLVNPPVIVVGEVTSKLPKAAPPVTWFFVDEDGNPTRNQTREPELPLSVAQIGDKQ